MLKRSGSGVNLFRTWSKHPSSKSLTCRWQRACEWLAYIRRPYNVVSVCLVLSRCYNRACRQSSYLSSARLTLSYIVRICLSCPLHENGACAVKLTAVFRNAQTVLRNSSTGRCQLAFKSGSPLQGKSARYKRSVRNLEHELQQAITLSATSSATSAQRMTCQS